MFPQYSPMKFFSHKSLFALTVLILLLLLTVTAAARPITVTASGDYNMDEFEPLAVAKERAMVNAMRSAAEQSSVYIESYSRYQNLQLTKDEVNSLAAAVLEILDKQFEQRVLNSGGLYIKATITCRVNPANIDSLRKKSQILNDYQHIQETNVRLQREMNEIKVQLLAAQNEAEKRHLTEAAAANDRAFEAVQWFKKGTIFLNNDNWDEAIAAYSKALELIPHFVQAYNNRGLAYHHKSLLDQAIADYTQAIMLDQLFVYAYNNRGLAFSDKGQFEQAIADYDRAIAINPRHASAYYNRGIVYWHKGLYDQAIADYTQAISINPSYDDAYYNRGVSYNIKGHYDQAIADYTQAIAISPRSDTYNNRGRIYQNKGQFNQAIADFNQAIAIKPREAKYYFNKAFACDQAGLYPEAIAAYQDFLQHATPEYARYIQYARQRLTALAGT